ncbi:hypothetical protein E4T43_08413 [Aureobasidium subglaciale]|nr:hypothetical protein E4T43_08413 [Aureobasidium subglaciale]
MPYRSASVRKVMRPNRKVCALYKAAYNSLGSISTACTNPQKQWPWILDSRNINSLISHIRRGTPDVKDEMWNHISKATDIQAYIGANVVGADEALMLDPNGFVKTCNSTNFFIVREGVVWAPTRAHQMQGITRAKTIELCRQHGIPVLEQDFTLTEAYGADEAFCTGTFPSHIPVLSIDGRNIGEGEGGRSPVTKMLSELYKMAVEEDVTRQRSEILAKLPVLAYDLIIDWLYYGTYAEDAISPCELYTGGPYSSTYHNSRPPLFTRVCHESRQVAFETGEMDPKLTVEEEEAIELSGIPEWWAGNVYSYTVWKDRVRDSTHLNWDVGHQIDWGYTPEGHPLVSLAREAKRLNGKASFMLEYLCNSWEGSDISYAEADRKKAAALKLLPEWLVVDKVIVIHLAFDLAVKTGLFGHLGDEVVQIVDAYLPLADQLYALAESCEGRAEVITAAQDFTRMSAEDMDAMVKEEAYLCFDDHEEIGKRLRPAIMFRLCTKMCNHGVKVEKEKDV